MPMPLAHALHARAYLAGRPELDRCTFIRAALFPDVRRLAGWPREQTHRFDVTLDEVGAETDAWKAGWLLHSWLDVAWDDFFSAGRLGIPELEDGVWRQGLKIFESVGIKAMPDVRAEFLDIFSGEPDDHELVLGVSVSNIVSWDSWNRWMLGEVMSEEGMTRHGLSVGFTSKEVSEVFEAAHKIQTDRRYEQLLLELHQKLGYGKAPING